MARAGEAIENPVTGERITWLHTTAETNGERLEYDLTFRPAGFVTQEHLHPGQSERHEVVSGQLGLELGGEEQVLGPGDVVVVPAAARHRLFRVGDEPVHARFELRPALRTEELIETFAGLARDGKVGKRGYPKLLQLAVLSREYEPEGYATRPPLAVQKAIFGPLAALGRLRGYRARYPRYSS